MNLKQLSALAGIGLSGCAHNPYAQDAPPMPAYIAGLNRHDQMVATTGYRLGQADTANAVYQAARRSSGRLPDTGETPASASATPEVEVMRTTTSSKSASSQKPAIQVGSGGSA